MSWKTTIDRYLENNLSDASFARLSAGVSRAKRLHAKAGYPYGRFIKTPWKRWRNAAKQDRNLEIGPGPRRIAGFETANVVWAPHVDYVVDASRSLPFRDGVFKTVYASHILEHTPWYRHREVLREWVRVLAPGGKLEIWVPDGLKVARSFVAAEDGTDESFREDGWWKFNEEQDPCLWFNGRTFSYGDGSGRLADPNWHLSLFSARYLHKLLAESGLQDIQPLSPSDVRGHDHGWINLGASGVRP